MFFHRKIHHKWRNMVLSGFDDIQNFGNPVSNFGPNLTDRKKTVITFEIAPLMKS